LSQIRIDFNHDSYVTDLPELYRTHNHSGDFTVRLLSLMESMFDELETHIVNLPTLFEPSSGSAAALSWIPGSLGLPLRDDFVRRDAESMEAFEARKVHSNTRFLEAAIPLMPYRGTRLGLEALMREWLKDDLLEADRSVIREVNTTFQLAPAKDEDRYPGEVYAQIGLTTVLGEEWPPFYFAVDLVLNPAVRELHHPAGIRTCVRAARFLIDQEKPAHCTYELRVQANYAGMQLTPVERSDRRPDEIYTQIGEMLL
jgi:phage tail-like protein